MGQIEDYDGPEEPEEEEEELLDGEAVLESKRPRKGRYKDTQDGFTALFYHGSDKSTPNVKNWDLLIRCCRAGLTTTQFATVFNTNRETFWRWSQRHIELADCISEHKSFSNRKVEEALYERATGYTVTVQKVMVVDKQIQIIDVNEHYPPDVKAAEIWLYNRDKANWQKMQQVNYSGVDANVPAVPAEYDMSQLSLEERKQLLELSKKAERAALPVASTAITQNTFRKKTTE